ncbi:CAP domain-containing protein [Clostridium sp.]|uniref:CAP domain-containing protein n=1 Tax=Clostridium sp. TaxID=1506 RepID=UPI003217CED6
MKKKFITLMICGAVVGTALVGVTIQNGKDWTSNSNEVLNVESKDLDNKDDLLEENTLPKIDSIKEEATKKQVVSESKENEVSMASKSGQAKGENTSQKNVTNYALEPKEEEIINNDNSTEEAPKLNNQPTPVEKSSTPVKKPATPSTPSISAPTPTPPSNQGDFSSQVEQLIFNKVNEERARAGVAQLSYSGLMEKYARIKSKDMGDRNYFDHKNPEGQLITTQMANDGVSYRAWGENIAYIGGVSDLNALANQFMTNWMNSQGHRENILSTNFTSIGVGVYKSGDRYYATQEFYK